MPLFESLSALDSWIISGGWWNRLPLSNVPQETHHRFTRLSFDPLLKTTQFFPTPQSNPALQSWTLTPQVFDSRVETLKMNQTALLDFWISSKGTWVPLDFEELDLLPLHWVGHRKGVGGTWFPPNK